MFYYLHVYEFSVNKRIYLTVLIALTNDIFIMFLDKIASYAPLLCQ
jgi:hypothetical protein